MRSTIFAFACLAACGGGSGVDIEVHGEGVRLDSVELYITYEACTTSAGRPCPPIGMPNAQTRIDGDVLVLGSDEKVVRTALVDGQQVLHLEAEPGFEQTEAIAIVGFQGDKPVAVEVLWGMRIDDAQHWLVRLHPAPDPASTDMTPPADDQHSHRLLAWAREQVPDPTEYAGCLAYQRWNDTKSKWEMTYFVPPSDPDCDGAPHDDCDPYWNHRTANPAACLTHSTVLSNVCALGTESCMNETPSSCMENAPLTCMPEHFCKECVTEPDLPGCIQSVVTDPNTQIVSGMPMYTCMYAVDPTTDSACTMGSAGETMNLTLPGKCGSALLRPLSDPFTGGAAMLNVGTATISVHALAQTSNNVSFCQVSLTWLANGSVPPVMSPMDGSLIVAVSYGERTVLMPVWIGFDLNRTCPSTPPPCTRSGSWPETGSGTLGDPMFECTSG